MKPRWLAIFILAASIILPILLVLDRAQSTAAQSHPETLLDTPPIPIENVDRFFAPEQGDLVPATHPTSSSSNPQAQSVTKAVAPTGQVKYGDLLTYTLLISAAPGAQVALYDPLQGTTFMRFVEPSPGITYTNGVITGALTVTPTHQVTVSFVAQVTVPGTAGSTVDVTNRACVYPFGGTLGGCDWSNEVSNPVFGSRGISVQKSVVPQGQVTCGDLLTYTLLISAAPGAQVALYDPLQGTTFMRFVEPSPGITHTNGLITGALMVTPTHQVTVSFVAQVDAGTASLLIAVTNRACVYPFGGTLGGCVWSNEVSNPRPQNIYLPLVLRGFPNLPPNVPSNPTPPDNADDQSVDLNLGWTGGDLNGDIVTYDVYLEADDDTPDVLVSSGLLDVSYDPGRLDGLSHYYWQIVATDEYGVTATGPVWDFFTGFPPPPEDWFGLVNHYRLMAGLPSVTENTTWSDGCWLHARYAVKNDAMGHTEDPNLPWYTPEGLACAQSANLYYSSSVSRSDPDAIDGWMVGPFHAVGVIDPALQQTAYGSYRESDGGIQMCAGLDVIRGLGSISPQVSFPVVWPADGVTTPLRRYGGGETPDPLSGCPGYSVPSGPPIILQIGPGDQTPDVTAHSFTQDSVALEHCLYDETSYTNSDSSLQNLGRSVLNMRDAIVLIPREPLTPGTNYAVSITVNGQTISWSFNVIE